MSAEAKINKGPKSVHSHVRTYVCFPTGLNRMHRSKTNAIAARSTTDCILRTKESLIVNSCEAQNAVKCDFTKRVYGFEQFGFRVHYCCTMCIKTPFYIIAKVLDTYVAYLLLHIGRESFIEVTFLYV